MDKVMIAVEGIGKQYRLHHAAADLRASPMGAFKRLMTPAKDHFWALRNVSFEVPEGEALGIIGRNGAGKSTLLKILSRITYPTEGRFRVEGRVSSLLEVGTGFHPELSGRENVYLNGTILGMRRTEVRRKFDEIVAFSGVERFIDNPVKHYSNGQKVRLAFAVAAHLEPEVLIIDEVLAVGDAEFQRKCLGKMKDVAGSGRTVLFVSHNMSAINSLCGRSLLLDQGRVEMMGPTSEVVERYLQGNEEGPSGLRDLSHLPARGDRTTRLRHLRWVDADGATMNTGVVTQPLGLEIAYEVLSDGVRPQPIIFLHNSSGEHVLTSFPGLHADVGNGRGKHTATVRFPADFFNEGTYHISLWLITWSPHTVHVVEENVTHIRVMDDLASVTRSPSYYVIRGALRPKLGWDLIPERSSTSSPHAQ
ncbi:MAG: polysaccharide ABC transporter ATP-binding protein [Flavobacteriales bacterium]